MIHCHRLEQNLAHYRVSRAGQLPDALAEHLKTCEACRAALAAEDYIETLAAMTEKHAPGLPPASLLLVQSRLRVPVPVGVRARFTTYHRLIHAALGALGASAVVLLLPAEQLRTWANVIGESSTAVLSVPPEALALTGVLAAAALLMFTRPTTSA